MNVSLKLYGPYLRKDGRKHVIWYNPETKIRRTQSYPRYLVEQVIGRELLPNEEVDHINGDYTDDRLENLQVLCWSDHQEKSSAELSAKVEWFYFSCPTCSADSAIPMRKYRANQEVRGSAGPYCSKRCASRAHPPPH